MHSGGECLWHPCWGWWGDVACHASDDLASKSRLLWNILWCGLELVPRSHQTKVTQEGERAEKETNSLTLAASAPHPRAEREWPSNCPLFMASRLECAPSQGILRVLPRKVEFWCLRNLVRSDHAPVQKAVCTSGVGQPLVASYISSSAEWACFVRGHME